QCKITKNLSQNVVHSDSDLILHNSSVLIDKEPRFPSSFSSIFLSFFYAFFCLSVVSINDDLFQFRDQWFFRISCRTLVFVS
ncbi:hypothetical protein BSQ85_13310, partial [Enterococcus faecium]